MASLQQLQRVFIADAENEHKYHKFYTCTILLGLLVGVCIQLSTVGINFLIVAIFSSEQVFTQRTLIVLSFCWSTLSSLFAFALLGCIRRYLGIEHKRIRQHLDDISDSEYSESYDDENDINDTYNASMIQVEHRFVAGAMIGVCLSWALCDLSLGLNKEVIYSIMTLAIALLWCQAVLKWTIDKSRKLYSAREIDDSYIAII